MSDIVPNTASVIVSAVTLRIPQPSLSVLVGLAVLVQPALALGLVQRGQDLVSQLRALIPVSIPRLLARPARPPR